MAETIYKFDVFTNIPVPPKGKGKRREGKYKSTLLGMNVGDSFFVPFLDTENRKLQNSRLSIIMAARKNGIVVTTRKVAGGLMVWKTGMVDDQNATPE